MRFDRRDFLKYMSLVATAGSEVFASTKSENNLPKSTRPNVIFILADDLGYGDLGCYGQRDIKTPNIDRLAKEGMKFTRFYAGSTVCAPSRCTLMTGLNTAHCRIQDNIRYITLVKEDLTVADLFKKAGYNTGIIGKWGLGEYGEGLPNNQGFDYFYGYLNQIHAHNYYPDFLWRNKDRVELANVIKRPDNSYPEANELGAAAVERVEYSQDICSDEAISFIRKTSEPFFLYLPYLIPHANNEAPFVLNEHGMEVPDEGIYVDKDWPEAQKCHAAMITKLDAYVGRIVQAVKDKGIDDDTIIIFTSDNGPHKEAGADPDFFDSNGPLRGIKRDLYEGGIRVPFIASWKDKIEAGAVNDHISAFWDFLPTISELVDIELEHYTDGISMLPTLRGDDRAQKQHNHLYWRFPFTGEEAILIGDWKGVWRVTGFELYNLKKDISEEIEISAEYPEIVKEFRELKERLYKKDQ